MDIGEFVSGYPMFPILVLFALYLVYALFARNLNPFRLAIGEDNRFSISKLQFLLWTIVALFAYTAIWGIRAHVNHYEAIGDIPANLLLAMGLSVTTAVAAKGIKESNIDNGKEQDDKRDTPSTIGTVVKSNDNSLDLAKTQLLVWTLVAVGIFLVTVNRDINAFEADRGTNANTPLPEIPDIDASLLVLMGLGQGAYLGKKLVTTTTPRLTGLLPGIGKQGTLVTIMGSGFCEMDGNLITIDEAPLDTFASVKVWADDKIIFTLPKSSSLGRAWSLEQPVSIGLIVGGQKSANTLPFSVTATRLTDIWPKEGPTGTTITLKGSLLGEEQKGSQIMLNGIACTNSASTWQDGEASFVLPDIDPLTKMPWTPNTRIRIGVRVAEELSPDTQYFTVTA